MLIDALKGTLFLNMLLLALAGCQTPDDAAKKCGGSLGGAYEDVEVAGGSCTLDGATVRGYVRVNGGGSLTVTGGTEIGGSIMVVNGGPIFLDDATVHGDVRLNESTSATVASGASAGLLRVERSGSIAVMGLVEGIESVESDRVTLNGATVHPGGLHVEKSSANVEICGSKLAGDVDVVESTGDLLIDSTRIGGTCMPSTIDGSVTVANGDGEVRLIGATLPAGGLTVSGQSGAVHVESAALAGVTIEQIYRHLVSIGGLTAGGDVSIADAGDVQIGAGSALGGDIEIRSADNVTLDRVSIGGGATIAENRGNAVIQSSELRGDLIVDSNAAVTVASNNFFLEEVRITNNMGPVLVDANIDLSLWVVENGNVTVKGNSFTGGEISQNNASISTIGNTHDALR